MGRMDVDYQVLHDAFFKWQTKPPLSGPGEVYYEGKEFEVHLKEKRPGFLSASLKAALGMPEGAPPPWLIARGGNAFSILSRRLRRRVPLRLRSLLLCSH